MSRVAKQLCKFTKKEIDTAFKTARAALRYPGLILLKAPRQGDFGRVLLSVPKRVGTAPERNLIRRRVKALFYEEKLYEGDSDWIALVRKDAKKLTFSQLKDLFLQAK